MSKRKRGVSYVVVFLLFFMYWLQMYVVVKFGKKWFQMTTFNFLTLIMSFIVTNGYLEIKEIENAMEI